MGSKTEILDDFVPFVIKSVRLYSFIFFIIFCFATLFHINRGIYKKKKQFTNVCDVWAISS